MDFQDIAGPSQSVRASDVQAQNSAALYRNMAAEQVQQGLKGTEDPQRRGVRERIDRALADVQRDYGAMERKGNAAHLAYGILQKHPEFADFIDALQVLGIVPR